MKMAKPSQQDIDAAGNAMSILNTIDRGNYPKTEGQTDAPDWFDEDDPEHLRRFYDAMKATLDAGPGWPGRVIGGMCYVIMFEENEILDPARDTLDLHPKFAKQEEQLATARALLQEVADQNLVVRTSDQACRIRHFLNEVPA